MIEEKHPFLPVVISTARGDVDDYIVKPCDPRELLARIKTHIKRAKNIHSNPQSIFTIDEQRLDLTKKDETRSSTESFTRV